MRSFTASNHQPFYTLNTTGRKTWYNSSNMRISAARAKQLFDLLKKNGVRLMSNAALVKRMKKINSRPTKRRNIVVKGLKRLAKKSRTAKKTTKRSTKKTAKRSAKKTAKRSTKKKCDGRRVVKICTSFAGVEKVLAKIRGKTTGRVGVRPGGNGKRCIHYKPIC